MNTHIDPEFASALRSTLLEQARASQSTFRRRYRRSAFIGLGSVVGLGVMGAAAAGMLGWPGGEVEKSLSATVQMDASGRATLLLGDAPKGANAVHFEFECKSPGTYAITTGGIAITCHKEDLAGSSATGLMDISAVTDGALKVTTESGGKWSLRAWYVDTSRAPLAANKHGETYGVESQDARPDLIMTAADNGAIGYVRLAEIEAAQDRASTSPTQAASLEPQVFEVPVYELDGKTVIGTFTWSAG